MDTQEEYIPKSVMTIFAHPDDQEFTVAGTLARWAQAGCQITCVLLTSGDAGSNDPQCSVECKPVLAQKREAEQLAANQVLGVAETVFLRFPDGELLHTLELRKTVTREIRRGKPEVVMCGDPTVRFFGDGYMNHPDHRVAADAACDAVFPSAGTRLIFTDLLAEGFEPHQVKRVYLSSTQNPSLTRNPLTCCCWPRTRPATKTCSSWPAPPSWMVFTTTRASITNCWRPTPKG